MTPNGWRQFPPLALATVSGFRPWRRNTFQQPNPLNGLLLKPACLWIVLSSPAGLRECGSVAYRGGVCLTAPCHHVIATLMITLLLLILRLPYHYVATIVTASATTNPTRTAAMFIIGTTTTTTCPASRTVSKVCPDSGTARPMG